MRSILFLGDSLTDGGWDRDPLGRGSAWPACAWRLAREAGLEFVVTNRAHGGDRSTEVLRTARALPAEPTWTDVVILVGTNDLWRRWTPWLDHSAVDPDDFRRNLLGILDSARLRGVASAWVCTPAQFNPDPNHPWNVALQEYREILAGVVRQAEGQFELGCALVPTGEDFDRAGLAHPQVQWTYDGVHPRPVGHERLAHTWLAAAFGLPPLSVLDLPPKPSDFKLSRWP